MQSSTISILTGPILSGLILASASALTTGAVHAQAARYTLTTVHDSVQTGEWVAAAPVAGDDGFCFLSLGSSSGPTRIVATDGASTIDLGPLPWPAAYAGAVRIADAFMDHAVIIAGTGDPHEIDSALLHWDGAQLVEVTRASEHFDDGYAEITDASVSPLAGLVFHVRGLAGSKLVFVGAQGSTTIWDSATAGPFELAWIDSIQAITCGDVVVSGTRSLPGQPGFSEYLLGRFRFDQAFAFEPMYVNSGASTDLLVGFQSWSASQVAGIVQLGGASTPGTERTVVQREITVPATTVLHRTACPEPWIAFAAVTNNDAGDYAFAGTARDCKTQQHLGAAVQVGPDPVLDRLLGVGDAFQGSTVTAVELSPGGLGDGGEIAFLVRLANLRTLIVRADPIPEIFPFCPDGDLGAACPCGNQGTSGRGCANSLHAEGALLSGSGVARTSNDTFTLTASSMPNSTALFFQGDDAQAVGAAFGDGVRCVSGTIVRLGQKAIAGGAATLPGPTDASISVRGAIPAGGDASRSYQCYYRNAASFCTSATFNVTNAVSVFWAP